MSQVLVIAGIALLVAGLALGLPAWRSWQARIAIERNAARYVAWRGRGDRASADADAPMTGAEQRRLIIAVVLLVLGGASLLIGLTSG
jgi:hypothetical protein